MPLEFFFAPHPPLHPISPHPPARRRRCRRSSYNSSPLLFLSFLTGATFLPGYFDMPVGVSSVMQIMTGSQDVRYHKIDTTRETEAGITKLYKSVRNALRNGAIVTCGTNARYCNVRDDLEHGGVKVGLVGNHAYSILGALTVRGTKLFHCRNPWGGTEWGGAWRDSDPRWTTAAIRECNRDPLNGGPFSDEEDGTFFISVADFCDKFSGVNTCIVPHDPDGLPDRLYARANAAAKELARVLALPGIRLRGHTGRRKEMMGLYLVNKNLSPMNDANVYTKEGTKNRHVYRTKDGKWWLGNTESAETGANSGFLTTEGASPYPFTSGGNVWQFHNGSVWVNDREMQVLEVSQAQRAAQTAASARLLAVRQVDISGHTAKFPRMMGPYSKNRAHSPMNGGNVFTMDTNSERHLYRSTSGKWWISDTDGMVAGKNSGYFVSSDKPISPFDVESWTYYNGSGWVSDPGMKVVASYKYK